MRLTMTKSAALKVLTPRVPKELIDRIGTAASNDLLSRSAEARRTC
jgi:hypothetical protein